jgi:hypothetical protein
MRCFIDRAPARIPAATKPIDAANIISMTTIATDHMLISAMMDGPFILFGQASGGARNTVVSRYYMVNMKPTY